MASKPLFLTTWLVLSIAFLVKSCIDPGFAAFVPAALSREFNVDNPNSFLCKSLKYLIAVPVILGVGWLGGKSSRYFSILFLLSGILIVSLVSLITFSMNPPSLFLFLASDALVHATLGPSLFGFACIFIFEAVAPQMRSISILTLFLFSSLASLLGRLVTTHIAQDGLAEDYWSHFAMILSMISLVALAFAAVVGYRRPEPPPRVEGKQWGTEYIIHLVMKSCVILQDGFLSTFSVALGKAASSSALAPVALTGIAASFGILGLIFAWSKGLHKKLGPLSFALAIGASCLASSSILLSAGYANNFFTSTENIYLSGLIALGCCLASLLAEAMRTVVMVFTLKFHSARNRSFGVARMIAGETASRFAAVSLHSKYKHEKWFYWVQLAVLILIFVLVLVLLRRGQVNDSRPGEDAHVISHSRSGKDKKVHVGSDVESEQHEKVNGNSISAKGGKPVVYFHKTVNPRSPLVVHRILPALVSEEVSLPQQVNLVPSAPSSPINSAPIKKKKKKDKKVSFFGDRKKTDEPKNALTCAVVSESSHEMVIV